MGGLGAAEKDLSKYIYPELGVGGKLTNWLGIIVVVAAVSGVGMGIVKHKRKNTGD